MFCTEKSCAESASESSCRDPARDAESLPGKQRTASSGTWTYSTAEEREWWSGLWADRTLASAYAQRATESGHATVERLRAVSDAWREWGSQEDGWFCVLHGEILCRKRV